MGFPRPEGLCDEVRRSCTAIAQSARHVAIDLDRLAEIEPGEPPALDPERHYLEGSREDVASYMLTLDTINFGSGWFPVLHKRAGCSGYFTVAWALADHWREQGAWTPSQLRSLDAAAVAAGLDQDAEGPAGELMDLYALVIARRTIGQKVRSRGRTVCRYSRRLPRARSSRCIRYVTVTTLTRRGRVGANSVTFTGRIRRRALPLGVYRVTATATDRARRRSVPRRAAFRIVRASIARRR